MNLLKRDSVRVVTIWIVLGSILGTFAARVRDFIDVDSERYQHLAMAIAKTHSLVPRIDGVDIHSYSQLYPLLIAPFFVHGTMVSDLEHSSVASAYIMASACIPAFLLTRRVTRLRWAPLVVAVLSVCMPWIVTSMFLMTEVAAYPACTWAVYALVVAIASPSVKHDLLTLLAIAVAFFARGELIVLALVLPLAVAAFEFGRAPAGRIGARLRGGGRALLRGHPALAAVYLAGGAVVLTLYLAHRLSSVIGIYSAYSNSAHPAYSRLPRSLVEHLATFSLGVGVVPFVIALAWIGANVIRPSTTREAHAFACVSAFMLALLFVQATNFDLVVNSYVHDRFLMYFVPVVLIGVALAVSDARKPRWSLVVPLVLVVAGFAFGAIPSVTWQRFPWLDLDTPIATVYRVLALHLGGIWAARAELIVLAVVGTGLFVLGTRRLRPARLMVVVLVFCCVVMPLVTAAVFVRTFASADRNARPVTQSQHGLLDWVDDAVGPNARVTAIPYPISSDWFVNRQRWVDFEYFNKSIVRDARIVNQDPFDYLGLWFPKLDLHFDPVTGAVAESPTPWIVESTKETRFRIAGPAKAYAEDGALIDAGTHWRLAWLTSGLYDDGWTKPSVPMRMRLYPRPGQTRPELRGVAIILRAATGSHAFTLRTDGRSVSGVATPDSDTFKVIQACVPAHGYGELRLDVRGSSEIPGDLATYNQSVLPRRGGVFIASLSEADEIGGPCTPASD